MAEKAAGTDDMIGAVITHVDGYAGTYGYVVQAEKNGVIYELSANEEWGTCMCDSPCYCSPSVYFSVTSKTE